VFFGYVDFTDDWLPYYVGIGNQARVNNLRRNTKHVGISKQRGCNRVVRWESVDWGLTKMWEVRMISFMKTFHYDDPCGIGCNFTRGGEGAYGCLRSSETRMKMRLAKLGKAKSVEHRANIGAAARGKPHPHKSPSPETRLKMSISATAAAKRRFSMKATHV
jgi:hypothetical protein